MVVDDGSTDGSRGLIREFQIEAPFEITYKICKNGGKMRAINEGVSLAKGEFFLIVDSDDYISENCCRDSFKLWKRATQVYGRNDIRKIDMETNKISGKPYPKKVIDSSPIEIVYNLGIDGDRQKFLEQIY